VTIFRRLVQFCKIFEDDRRCGCNVDAETERLAAAWYSNKFLNPATDVAVLLIPHVNGYKIANPTVLARIRTSELKALSGPAENTSRYLLHYPLLGDS
jgi:hypothetical protein